MTEELPTMKQLSIIFIGICVNLFIYDQVIRYESLTQNLQEYKQASRIRWNKGLHETILNELSDVTEQCSIAFGSFDLSNGQHGTWLLDIKRQASNSRHPHTQICKERWLLVKNVPEEEVILMGRVCSDGHQALPPVKQLHPQMSDGYVCVSTDTQRWIGVMTPESLQDLLIDDKPQIFIKTLAMKKWQGQAWSMNSDRHFQPCQTAIKQNLRFAFSSDDSSHEPKWMCDRDQKVDIEPNLLLNFTRSWQQGHLYLENEYHMQFIPQFVPVDIKREKLDSKIK